MIDIHAHLLPGIDDGAMDFDISIKMLQTAEHDGIKKAFVTPHYVQFELENTVTKINEHFERLKSKVNQAGIGIELYLGTEAFVTMDLPTLLKNGVVQTMNHSKYVLVEMPLGAMPRYMDMFIYQMCSNDYIPIIAHPERNGSIIKNPKIVQNFVEKGALIQMNAGSIQGFFGLKTKKVSRLLLKHHMAHFVASDAHDPIHRPMLLHETRKTVEKLSGEQYTQKLFETNALQIIQDGYVEPLDMIPIKRKWFFLPVV